MNNPAKLTTNQKRVIVGLCLFPMSSDSEIASMVSVKRSTFSTIKKQLITSDSPLIFPINIPNASFLGAEVISFSYAYLDHNSFRKNQRFIESGFRKIISYFPNIIYSAFDLNKSFSFMLSKHYTDSYLAHKTLVQFYCKNKLCVSDDLQQFNAPITNKSILVFMNYGSYLQKYWDIDLSLEIEYPYIFSPVNKDPMQISSQGWQIFNILIENPSLSIIDLANLSDKPRNTIARWVNLFKKKNLFQTRYIPNLSLLGFQIQSFYILTIEGYSQLLVTKILNTIIEILNPTNLFHSKREIFFSIISKDYLSHRGVETSFFKKMNEMHLPYMIQRQINLSIQNITIGKSLQSSFTSLISYLQRKSKYTLKLFSDENFLTNNHRLRDE